MQRKNIYSATFSYLKTGWCSHFFFLKKNIPEFLVWNEITFCLCVPSALITICLGLIFGHFSPFKYYGWYNYNAERKNRRAIKPIWTIFFFPFRNEISSSLFFFLFFLLMNNEPDCFQKKSYFALFSNLKLGKKFADINSSFLSFGPVWDVSASY